MSVGSVGTGFKVMDVVSLICGEVAQHDGISCFECVRGAGLLNMPSFRHVAIVSRHCNSYGLSDVSV